MALHLSKEELPCIFSAEGQHSLKELNMKHNMKYDMNDLKMKQSSTKERKLDSPSFVLLLIPSFCLSDVVFVAII